MANTTSADVARLVICGSMRAWDNMREVQETLDRWGIDSLIPDTDAIAAHASVDELHEAKRAASMKHFECIQDTHTTAVLVVNVDKEGQANYIGPNAFAEIAVAVASGRRVYLLNSIPSAYSDELQAWGARELHGELHTLAHEMRDTTPSYAHAS
ncbi:hypothetical protein [Microbacterium sp. WCS2018Hpa-9]|uniref:hypothetical protein n=1 Tax=Microbacterium sp. WCS2018Hpa-9 TaxID=3073635 RepID=UPI00288C27CF|nr:hypothetical protein [Microbacterium sp. WCS2018Hpa-9]